jgi:hypothetical protein
VLWLPCTLLRNSSQVLWESQVSLFLRQQVPHDHGFVETGNSHWFLCF